MDDYEIIVKSFIVNDGKILLLEDSSGKYDVPFIISTICDNYINLLISSVKKDTNLDIEIHNLITKRDIKYFKDDFEMHLFLCSANNSDIILSSKYKSYLWIDIRLAKDKISDNYREDFNKLYNIENDRFP